jgi:two-component system phosphate regulon sensor histidine kinase PhoR
MRSLRARIALAALVTSALGLLAVPLLVWPGLRERTIEHARQGLLTEARLLARLVAEPLARGTAPAALDALVDDAARDARARATLIGLDGHVLADSSVSGAALLALENHGGRPEVTEALTAGSGTAVRHSTTVERDLLYAAVPVMHEGRTLGVARLSLSLEGVEAHARDLARGMMAALLLALVVALALGTALASPIAGPIQQMMDTARRFAGGDFGARVAVARDDEIGELARILNQAADLLQSRLTEIARDRARTEAILASMQEGLLAVDARGVVVVASEATRRDLAAGEPVGRHYLEVVRQREISSLLQTVLDTGRPQSAEVEMRPLRRIFAISVVPFPTAEGQAKGALATFHDVTERRRVDQIRRDFVANASHELRTPLTSIRGFVEALEDGADAATSQRFLGKIRTHSDRMAALLDDLLELSRLESGERPPQIDSVNVREVLDDVVTSFTPAAEQKRIALAASGPPLAVLSDGDRLRRVLECLVDNAVKYTPADGSVTVAARATDAGVAVDVKDDGPGIPPEHLPRLFERFYRVDKARSRELGGTGLGLSIARHLAERMGAKVEVSSEVGVGTCFTVTVPQEPPAAT